MPIITLTTDFGNNGPYVAAMKGVILSRVPDATIVDIDHAIRPQHVFEASFVFEQAYRYFPEGTVHLVVVDPGVGTSRRRLAMESDGHLFVGPDNGCLSCALPDDCRGRRGPNEAYDAREVGVPEAVTIRSLENEAFMRLPLSATFEGRDAFAPAAAALAAGTELGLLGLRVEKMTAFPAVVAPASDGGLDGLVVYVDRFGNLVTDICAIDLPPEPAIEVSGHVVPLSRTYGAAQGVAAIIGSYNMVEIAVPGGSAAAVFGLGAGTRVRVAGTG